MLRGAGWGSGPLQVATTRRRRRRGSTPVAGPFGMLLATRSIHGWGMAGELLWIGIGGDGVVVATGILRPRRLVLAPRPVRWIAEVPLTVGLPRVGDRLGVVPILASWPDD